MNSGDFSVEASLFINDLVKSGLLVGQPVSGLRPCQFRFGLFSLRNQLLGPTLGLGKSGSEFLRLSPRPRASALSRFLQCTAPPLQHRPSHPVEGPGCVPPKVRVTTHPNHVQAEQREQLLRQHVGRRQLGGFNQDRDHRAARCECFGELHAHEIIRQFQASDPGRADQRDDSVNRADVLPDDGSELDSTVKRVDVAEHVLLTERLHQLVVEPTDKVEIIASTVREEHPSGRLAAITRVRQVGLPCHRGTTS